MQRLYDAGCIKYGVHSVPLLLFSDTQENHDGFYFDENYPPCQVVTIIDIN